MKANEAPESKFVYPDKLYARCKDNKTLDISYAPQNMEAVEYVRTDVFIEKAVSWFKEQDEMIGVSFQKDFLERFQNYMKGE